VLLDRLREVVDVFAGLGVSLALETGQERAEDLAGFLEDLGRESVGVNFDPANMILYGMGDPLASLRRLAPRVVQVHLKDAVSCPEPGRWGREVRLGAGEVVWDALLLEIRSWPRRVNLLVERESGEERVSDAAAGLELVRAVVRQWEPAGV
jgi:sugar phosphate isomerase/epimerase